MNYFRRENINQNLRDYLRENPLLTNHLGKALIDIEEKKIHPDFRKYKDETTTQFNRSFFMDNNNNNIQNLNNFTFYTFQKINFDIISNINDSLRNLNENINNDEDIILLFKGGNIMNYYLNNIIETLSANNNSVLVRDFFTNYNICSISDTDYTIYILTNDERKFNLIYKFVSDILYKSLIEIRNTFEGLLNHKINNKNTNYFQNQNLDNNLEHNYIYNEDNNINILNIEKDVLQKLNSIFNINSVDRINNKFQEIIDYLTINNIIQRRNDDIYAFSIFKDIYNGARYIKMLSSIRSFYFKYNNMAIIQNNMPQVNLDFMHNNIVNIIQTQRNESARQLNNVLFELNNFYSREKIISFLNEICSVFNEPSYRNNSYYEYVSGKHKYNSEYKMSDREVIIYHTDNNLRIDNNNILPESATTYLSKKKDFILSNIADVDFTKYVQNNDDNNKHYHYITVNSSINNIIDPSRIVQFDLYRIKLNVLLSHIINIDRNNTRTIKKLNIPSEFIDVSIPKFSDMNLSNFRKKIYSNNHTYNDFFSKLSFGNKKNILMYNLSYLVDDILFVLFSQNYFFPWADPKYNKRLKRIALLSFIIFLKKSSVNTDMYNSTQEYLIRLDASLKNICNNLYYHYNHLGYFNNLEYFNNSGYLNANGTIRIEYRPEVIIQYRDDIVKHIEDFIEPFIANNNYKILFDVNIIRNFEKNSEYFIIDYNKLFYPNSDSDYDFNLIFKNSFDKLFSFLFRNIIYDIKDPDSFHRYINSQIDKFNIIFDSDNDKNLFVEKFRIENYICLKTFHNIFKSLMIYFYYDANITINHAQDLSIENLHFLGGVQNEFNNNKIKEIRENYNKKLNNIKDNNLIEIHDKNYDKNNDKNNNKNKNYNKKLNNIKDNNLIEIQEKSIRFNDILIEDLDCNFKINANTKNLYCGVLDDDYEPSDDYK